MDIRDLQYGDLVLVNGTVNRVDYDLLHQMTLKDNANWEIKGLPLTAEFLEANGFNDLNKGLKEVKLSYARYIRSVNHPFGDEYGRDRQSIIVYWRENSSDVYIERPFGYNSLQTKAMCDDIVYDIVYVHELQHLLNICGLNEVSYDFQYGKQQD